MSDALNDADRADLCAAIYDPASKWDAGPFDIQNVYFAVRRVDGRLHFVFRGSWILRDWERDAASEVAGKLGNYPALGPVPLGFSLGMDAALDKVFEVAGDEDNADFDGHSLGGGHGIIAAAQWASVGRIPSGAFFAAPRAGMKEMKELLAPFDLPVYKNVGDWVPTKPTDPPWLDVTRSVALSETPHFMDIILDPLFAHHHIALYQLGARKLFP